MITQQAPKSLEVDDVLNNVRILFTEDSPTTVQAFKDAVGQLGWEGLYASNAVEMMNMVNSLITDGIPLDGVVADISFLTGPKLTGITAVREIRKVMPNVPVIFVSAYVTSIIREEVRRVHAEILEKPVSMESLFLRLSQLIYWNRLATTTEISDDDVVTQQTVTRHLLSIPERIASTLRDKRDNANAR